MFIFIKNHKTLLIVSVLATLGILYYLFAQRRPAPSSPTPPPTGASWNGITPGVSTELQVRDVLGGPKSQNDNVLNYESKSPTRDTQIIIQNGTAVLVKEMVAFSEKRTTDEITSKYGDPSGTLYGPGAVNGNYLYIYPEKGIAYLGNPLTKSLQEIWYFKPVSTLSDFQSLWAQDYSDSQTQGQF